MSEYLHRKTPTVPIGESIDSGDTPQASAPRVLCQRCNVHDADIVLVTGENVCADCLSQDDGVGPA